MSTTALDRRPTHLPSAPPATPSITASEERRPNRSVRCGLRVLRCLHDLGPHEDHQVSEIAAVAGLRSPHVSRLLGAAVDERVAERGARHGSYRLTRAGRALLDARPAGPADPRIRQALTTLHTETGLAVAYHQPGWRPGTGLRLELVDALCPRPELQHAIDQQHENLRHSAAGRAAIAGLPEAVTTGPDDQRLQIPAHIRESVSTSRIAVSRTPSTHALATCVRRATTVVAVLTALGPTPAFADPLRVHEYAVLLRRAAHRLGGPAAAPPVPLTPRAATAARNPVKSPGCGPLVSSSTHRARATDSSMESFRT
ncbi:hypothetical protein [Streptomyces sp. NPDC015125]|uniref:hypothetical protein n=1 Tax=Streptomyces sp. NPDC015125 TaxID=3364938 RepID=UPI0036F9FA97